MKLAISFFLFLLFLMPACSQNKVYVSSSFELNKVQKIAVLPLAGLKEFPGVGETVSSEITNHLVKYQFRVVERMLIDKVFSEQKLSQSGSISYDEMKQLGNMLSVDAILVGAVERFKPEKSTKISYVPEERKMISEKKMAFSPSPAPSLVYEAPQTDYDKGSISVSFRLVSVETGEVIAAGTGDEYADTTAIAIRKVSDSLCRQMRKGFNKWSRENKGK